MSEEEGPSYKDGEIVWVKLGSCWWPGEVTETPPEDYSSKKPPLVIVKFFNEDSYEFIKSYNNIYEYNCDKKNEFIRKGMDSYRGNNAHMSKFPGDVSLAEIRTNGNPNIINDPKFAPQKRTSIIAEVFGSPAKKTPKNKLLQGRRSKSGKKSKVNITHRRFLGCDDYESHVRIQYPCKDSENLSDSEKQEIKRLNREPDNSFDCSICNFRTERLEVMVLHVQSHSNDMGGPIRKKTLPKKKKRLFKHVTSDDDGTNSSVLLNSDSEEEVKPKRKKKPSGVPKKRKQKKLQQQEEETEKSNTDIKSNLLAEWSDDDEETDATNKLDTSEENNMPKQNDEDKKNDENNKSCFDFEEEEEELDSGVVQTAIGRKIPRVIPPTDKKKLDDDEPDLPIAEDDANRMEILKVSNESPNEPTEKTDEVFKDLMDSTVVPELPDLPEKIESTTSKTNTEVATKLTNPKKRFVKSFEDFELLQNEKRAQEEREKAVLVEAVESPTVSPSPNLDEEESSQANDLKISNLKCQIMSKLSDDEVPKTRTRSHRSPRRKILELYKNDRSKEKRKSSSDEKEDTKSTPKKSKYFKFKNNQPEEESNEKVEEEEETPKVTIEEVKEDVVKEIEETQKPDEEISKIDEYLNDFLFEFPKKETPTKEEEKPQDEQEEQQEETKKDEVQIKCAVDENDQSDIDFSIKTNLSNLSKTDEDSGLNTLAMIAEIDARKTPVEEVKEPVKLPQFEEKPEAEMVPIDGNLTTVVSEKELADAQVEITASTSPTCKKPVTLTNFSMDFAENNNSELPNELEEKKTDEEQQPLNNTKQEAVDIEEQIPSQVVDKAASTSKLLERLTDKTDKKEVSPIKPVLKSPQQTKTKYVVKPGTQKIVKQSVQQSNKPIILSEKIIKPIKGESPSSVSIQKVTSKRNLQDADEIDTYIIHKEKKNQEEEDEESDDDGSIQYRKLKKPITTTSSANLKKRGKAKILQQTIITPSGEILQPTGTTTTSVSTPSTTTTTTDDNVFDINSMPIVLSDQILTPENIESMPIYLSGETEPVQTKTVVQKKTQLVQQPMRVLNKTVATTSTSSKLVKTPKILGTMASKIIKSNSYTPGSSTRQGKYVIVTQAASSSTPPTSKYTVGKKQTIVKRMGGEVTGTLTKVPNLTPDHTGNKVMILTDQQGQQQRVLLTPAQQKLIGFGGNKTTKTIVKGNILQKRDIAGTSGLVSKVNSNQKILTSVPQTKLKQIPVTRTVTTTCKLPIQGGQKVMSVKQPQQKTILIKNQHGQTVRKIQGTDDALLDKQVAEQIEAIKASGILNQKQQEVKVTRNVVQQPQMRKSYGKKVEAVSKVIPKMKEPVVPPLAPISPKKITTDTVDKTPTDRPLHQLVIQDAMGNQTTITEGQILALPSETVDGQPQSYMLVTLDESGNLTPLNNEALLSLDPNLGLGGDLGNTVLQIDQSALKEDNTTTASTKEEEKTEPEEPQKIEEKQTSDPEQQLQNLGETGQQLIVTGDPIAAQKFLESLTEGNTDLANILANAEGGGSILIHADGQQILINTESSDNQMLLSVNTTDSSEGVGNPVFSSQPSKNQDILAAALADTDVFQQEQQQQQQQQQQNKVSELSPNSSTLYPMNVGNVLETSLTLNSPIMTPLEVPSAKKISDENDILGQVPKNVDLPITITDPNISQTVSQQQQSVASLMAANELQTNLELSLPISETSATTSSEMNSPSFYSLSSLETEMNNHQKPFNSSMPLLTEDPEDGATTKKDGGGGEVDEEEEEEEEEEERKVSDGSFLDDSEGLCTLGGEMCSSLSEPPPDMFDLSAVLSQQMKAKEGEESKTCTNQETSSSSPPTLDDDSCEIPVQPEIVASLKEDEKSGGEKID